MQGYGLSIKILAVRFDLKQVEKSVITIYSPSEIVYDICDRLYGVFDSPKLGEFCPEINVSIAHFNNLSVVHLVHTITHSNSKTLALTFGKKILIVLKMPKTFTSHVQKTLKQISLTKSEDLDRRVFPTGQFSSQ